MFLRFFKGKFMFFRSRYSNFRNICICYISFVKFVMSMCSCSSGIVGGIHCMVGCIPRPPHSPTRKLRLLPPCPFASYSSVVLNYSERDLWLRKIWHYSVEFKLELMLKIMQYKSKLHSTSNDVKKCRNYTNKAQKTGSEVEIINRSTWQISKKIASVIKT